MKICTKCKIEKPEESFSFRYKARGIRLCQCKTCMAENNKRHYAATSEVYIKRAAKRKAETLKWYKEYKKSLKCNRCGFNHPAALQFHHVDGETKEALVSKMALNSTGVDKILNEISKCEVLCANCHLVHHNGMYYSE